MKSMAFKQEQKAKVHDHGTGNDTFGEFAQQAFRGHLSQHFARKVLRHPLLKSTRDEESDNAIRISKVILAYMGDLADYRGNMEYSYQPNMGSVMGRLYRELGVSVTEGHMRRHPHLEDTQVDGESIKQLPNKPKRGTLRKLKATLTLRLFRNKNKTVFHQLPLEESLRTQLEQIHFIIGLGILKPELRDEIYCQICRQLRNNPIKLSVKRGWVLLQLIAGCFAPSPEILDPILDYLRNGPPIYAPVVKKVLQRTIKNGTRFQPPAPSEVEAVWERKPLDLQMMLMDGTQQCLVADAATTSRELVHRLCNTISLHDKFGFSVFISMENKVASLGNGSDNVLDAISQCEQMFVDHGGKEGEAPWHLYFRKEIFAPWENTTPDITATDLIFSQVVRGIMLGEYVCHTDNDLATLAARQYYIEYGGDISEEGLAAVLPSYIPPDFRKDDEQLKFWRKTVLKTHQRMFASIDESERPSSYRVRVDVVDYARLVWPTQFSRHHDITRVDGPICEEGLRLAVNSTGLYLESSSGSNRYGITYPGISSISSGDGPAGSVSGQAVMFMLVNGATMRIDSPDAKTIRSLVTYMMDGLRERSKHAVAVQAYTGDAGELTLQEGDLVVLSKPAGQEALKSPSCDATSSRSHVTGRVNTSHIYVLPILTQPQPHILRLFQSQLKKGLADGAANFEDSSSNSDADAGSSHSDRHGEYGLTGYKAELSTTSDEQDAGASAPASADYELKSHDAGLGTTSDERDAHSGTSDHGTAAAASQEDIDLSGSGMQISTVDDSSVQPNDTMSSLQYEQTSQASSTPESSRSHPDDPATESFVLDVLGALSPRSAPGTPGVSPGLEPQFGSNPDSEAQLEADLTSKGPELHEYFEEHL